MVTCHGLVDGWCLSGATSGKEDRMGAPGGNRQGRDSEAHSDLPGTAGRPGPMTAAQRPQAAGTTQETEGTQGPACRVDGAARAAAGRYRILGEARVGMDPEGVVADATTGLAYVACSRSNAVSVVDLETMTQAGAVGVGREPIDIVIDPRTRRVFTADARSDQVSVIDAGTGRVIAVIPVGAYPAGLGIDEENRRLYCGDTMGSTMSVIDIDALERVGTVTAELGAGAVAADPRAGRVYCVNFVASSVTVVSAGDLRVVDRLPMSGWPCAVAVNPRRDEFYVVRSFPGGVVRLASASNETLAEMSTPVAPVGLAVGPEGDRLYLGNRGDGSVSVLGLDGLEWARIPVGAAPGGVAIHPGDPRVLLVANSGSGTLTVAEDLLDGPPAALPHQASHPLVGQRLPDFSLPDLRTGQMRHGREWAEKKYILNFFASW